MFETKYFEPFNILIFNNVCSCKFLIFSCFPTMFLLTISDFNCNFRCNVYCVLVWFMLHTVLWLYSIMVNKYIEFFCNVDSFLYLEFLFYHIFYADNCHIADKKIFQGDWCSCWCEIYWSNVYDPCNSSKCIRWNSVHCTWTKCC